MNNTKKENVLNIIKDILLKSCVYFAVMPIALAFTGGLVNYFIVIDPNASPDFIMAVYGFYNNPNFLYGTYLMFALAALWAGAAAQVFKIKKIPEASLHIAFFILIYLDFLLIFIPFSPYTLASGSTLYLSIAFIVIYLIIFGIVAAVKKFRAALKEKKSGYKKQFENFNG